MFHRQAIARRHSRLRSVVVTFTPAGARRCAKVNAIRARPSIRYADIVVARVGEASGR